MIENLSGLAGIKMSSGSINDGMPIDSAFEKASWRLAARLAAESSSNEPMSSGRNLCSSAQKAKPSAQLLSKSRTRTPR